MPAAPDVDLLDQFARTGSEAAFGELVRRHVGLVHSVALRHTNQPHQAEEITQAVFIMLARKAAAMGRQTVLSGWLYPAARLTAANFRRAEYRRRHREQEAFMQSTLEENPPDEAWSGLAPLLDEAMARLGATDRDAVVLRYFEGKSFQEIGIAFGASENAAKLAVVRGIPFVACSPGWDASATGAASTGSGSFSRFFSSREWTVCRTSASEFFSLLKEGASSPNDSSQNFSRLPPGTFYIVK